MTSAEKFWDKTAVKYSKSPIKNMDAYNQTLDLTRTYLTQESSVLEIGCGTGGTALLLAGSVKHITASDISANMINIAKSKAGDAGKANVTFLQGDVFMESLLPESFDAVLAFNLLHLVEDLPETLQRIRILLRPGGRFISKSACVAQQSRLWGVPIFLARTLGVIPPINMLTFDTLEQAISDAQFQITEAKVFEGSSMSRFIVAEKL
ncbi:MAG: class I SAM-dependent methyltransferase [Rhodospirillaceae bacterium]